MSKGSKTSSTSSSPWGPTQGYLKDALSSLEGLYSSGGMTTDYSGDWVADLTDDQKAALSGITDATSSGNNTLSSLISSLTGTATGENTTQNWDTIKNNVIADIMPSINSTFAGSNMTGSTLHQQNLSQGLSNGLATAQNDYNQQQFENQLSAGSSISSLLDQIIGNNQTAYDAATQVQNQEQNELDSQYTNSLLGQNADFEALSNYLSLLSGVGSAGKTSTATESSNSGLLGLLGSAGAASAGVGSLLKGWAALSDRRLKTDVKRVGQTNDGLPIYTYRYVGGDMTHMGVMAQDVQLVNPDAVVDAGGFLAVNYGAL